MNVIAFFVDPERDEAIAGDLAEEFGERVPQGVWTARTWLASELLLVFVESSLPLITLAVGVGAVAGIETLAIAIRSTRGPLAVMLYAPLVLAMIVISSVNRAPAAERFALPLIAFMSMSLVLYFGLRFAVPLAPLPLTGHAWRLGFMCGIGIVVALSSAAITGRTLRFASSIIALSCLGGGAIFLSLGTRSQAILYASFLCVGVGAAAVLRRARGLSAFTRMAGPAIPSVASAAIPLSAFAAA
jgi:hypothetical protein